MVKYFTLLFLVLCLTSTAQPTTGTKPLNVVLYTFDGNLFEDYPLDTLVNHLNLINKNPSIVYKVKRQDTDPSASLLIQLTLVEKSERLTGVTAKEKMVTRPVMRAFVDAGGQTHYEVVNENDHVETVIEENKEAARIFLTMEVFRPEPLKKLRYRHWMAYGTPDSKTALIIRMIKDIDLYCNESVRKKRISSTGS